ncbi:MAG: hypothetical protein AAGA87_10590 [Pseudomonadota bacterium]
MTLFWVSLVAIYVVVLFSFAVLGRYDLRRVGQVAALLQSALLPALIVLALLSEDIGTALAVGLIPFVTLSLVISGIGWLAGRIWRTEAL